MKILIALILSSLVSPLFASTSSCPGRDLSAFRMSPVFYKSQKVIPFLLNLEEKPYRPCSGQSVLLDSDSSKIIVGVKTKRADGSEEISKVDYSTLLKNSRNFQAESPNSRINLPLPNNSLNEVQSNNVKELTLSLINQFHNSQKICRSVDQSSFRLKTLLEAWRSFCQTNANKIACQRAMEVDMLSRTIAFEAHPLGQLDNISDVLNTPIEKFRTSTCERVYIGITLRNRKYEKKSTLIEEEKESRRLSKRELLSYSPYFYDGLDGAKYNIWKNEHVKRSFIAACFSKSSNLDNHNTKESYNYRVFKRSFLSIIAHTYDVLFEQSKINERVSFISSQSRQDENVDNIIKHYYHPRAMPKCFYQDENPNWLTRRNASGVIACREILVQGNLIKDCVLVKNEPHRLNLTTGEIQWVQSNKHDRNLKYNWTENQPAKWYLERALTPSLPRLYQKIENELRHTYSDLNQRRFRYCETFSNKSSIGNLAPGWALNDNVPRLYTIQCRLDGLEEVVELGGLDDPRIAPVVTDEKKNLMTSPINKMSL